VNRKLFATFAGTSVTIHLPVLLCYDKTFRTQKAHITWTFSRYYNAR